MSERRGLPFSKPADCQAAWMSQLRKSSLTPSQYRGYAALLMGGRFLHITTRLRLDTSRLPVLSSARPSDTGSACMSSCAAAEGGGGDCRGNRRQEA